MDGNICTSLSCFGVAVEEEGVEATEHGGGGHGPDEHLHRQRHDGGDLVGEDGGEHGGEQPHGGLDLRAAPRAVLRPLEQPEAVEEEEEVEVGEGHEGNSTRVPVRPVDRHCRVEGQEGEPDDGQQRGALRLRRRQDRRLLQQSLVHLALLLGRNHVGSAN